MMDLNWMSASESLHLAKNDVHLWRANFSPQDIATETDLLTLSGDELERAERFHSREDADQYIWHHTTLRQILSLYLNLHPQEIVLRYTTLGKPSLHEECNPHGLCFNLSHASEILLIGLACNREIGVDVEKISPIPDMDSMVKLYFSQSEIERFSTLTETEKRLAFFAVWTRKEAFLKAIGEGFQFPPDQVETSMDPEEPFPSLRLLGEDQPDKAYRLFSFHPADEYQAALAVEGSNWNVKAYNHK